MVPNQNLIEVLISDCSKSPIQLSDLANCCKDIRENLKFDCVFIARAGSPEESLSIVALDGKEEVMETCLYRLGAEERNALSKLPFKTYLDITGKPVFNKAGSLRIQKPNSGVFLALNRPKKSFLLFGCAHQNSQDYDKEALGDLSTLWKLWQGSLERAIQEISSAEKSDHENEKITELKESIKNPIINPLEGIKSSEIKDDKRRPVVLVDEVTRLFNKEYFSECLSIEVERARRYSRSMSLMFLYLSTIDSNPTRMDENLIATQVTEVLSKSLRRIDVICRLDKDKYGIILPDTANTTYGIIAKRIFKYFKQIMGETPLVSINISASTYPKHAEDHHALLSNTDKLLAQAREVGPNKAVLPE